MERARVDTLQMAEKPEAARQRILYELIPTLVTDQSYTLVSQDQQSFTLTKKYRPQWATVLAVLGALLILIGLLFLLVKQTQTVIITLSPHEKGTRVIVTGARNAGIEWELTNRLGATVETPQLATGS